MGRSSGDQGISDSRTTIRKALDNLVDPAFEKIIYTLSSKLGGRSEVLETPILEALSYLDMARKDREQERLDNFHALFYGANSKVEGKARKAYYDKIKPRDSARRVLGNKPMEWDYAKMDEFRAKTE